MSKFFKTIEELKAHITIESDFKLPAIEPYLLQVESGKFVHELGAPFYAAISGRYQSQDPVLTSDEAAVIALIQNSISHLSVVQGLPSLMVSLSGTGMMQKTTGEKKGLYEWQKLEYENSHLDMAYTALEATFELLWHKRTETAFATWKDSDAEKRSLAFVVNTAKDFNEYYPIGNSRRTFEALRSSIRDAENVILKPLLGKPLYDEIKAQILVFNVSEKNQKLMPMVKGITANSAICRAIPLLTFKVTSEGMMVTSVTSSGTAKSKQQTTPTPEMIRDMKKAAQETVDNYVTDLLTFLHANIGDYPLFKESDHYSDSTSFSNVNSTHTKVVSL